MMLHFFEVSRGGRTSYAVVFLCMLSKSLSLLLVEQMESSPMPFCKFIIGPKVGQCTTFLVIDLALILVLQL